MGEEKHTALITVVIPTYNRMPYIIEAIQSVIAQTYTNWELLIVDDGSTDDTVDVIQTMNDDRIKIIPLKHLGLIGPLRNAGALAGKGEWICFLDSDDVWKPQKLELQLNALKQSGFSCCYTNFELMDEKSNTIPVKSGKFVAHSGDIIKQVLTTEAAVSVGSLMLSRELFKRTGGFSADPKLMYRDDYEFAIRLAASVKIIAVADILLRVREYPGRGTNLVTAADSHERSAIPYKIFMETKPASELIHVAQKKYRQHYKIAARLNFKLGKYGLACRQLKKMIAG